MYENDELMHYGVKGMKWGVIRAKRADKKIRAFEKQKKFNEVEQKYRVKEAKIKYAGKSKKAKKLNKILNQYKKTYEDSVDLNNYEIAKQKAKKNPSYKKSDEYIILQHKGRKVMGKAWMDTAVLTLLTGDIRTSSSAYALVDRHSI